MNIFFVVLDDDNRTPDTVHSLISKYYEDTSYRLNDLTWVVAADASPAEICQKLGIDKKTPAEKRMSGVVALIEDYSGYADKSLWQLMRTWSAS